MYYQPQTFTLTDEECELVTKNHNLIYSYLNKFNLSDEYYDLCAIGLCRAAHFYDPAKEVTFSTFAFTVMSNEVKQYWRKVTRQVPEHVSLNTIIEHDGTTKELGEVFVETKDFTEYSDTIVLIQQYISKDPITAKAVPLFLQGYSIASIARKIGVEKHNIYPRINKFKEMLKKL